MNSEPASDLGFPTPSRSHPTATVRPSDDLLLSEAIAILRGSWKIIAGVTVGLIAIVAASVLVSPARYTATMAFLPQSKQMPSAIAGLASQFQLNLPSGDATQSPQYYLDLMQSRDVLQSLVKTRFEFGIGSGKTSGTLVELYDAPGKTRERRVDATIALLESDMKATVSQKSGLIRVSVTQRNAQLAQMVAQRLLALLSEFNVQTHQSQAAAERHFAELRRDEVHNDLRTAENRLQDFLQQNREYRNSPGLVFEQDRLAREVNTQQQLYTALSQSAEQARIEEVRDTPVFTIIEQPAAPSRPDSPGLILKIALAALLGVTLSLFILLWRNRPAWVRTG